MESLVLEVVQYQECPPNDMLLMHEKPVRRAVGAHKIVAGDWSACTDLITVGDDKSFAVSSDGIAGYSDHPTHEHRACGDTARGVCRTVESDEIAFFDG